MNFLLFFVPFMEQRHAGGYRRSAIKGLFPNRDLFGMILGISVFFHREANREENGSFL